MVLARYCRSHLRSALYALALAGTAPLAGCGHTTTAPPGTPVVTLSDTNSDFASYWVAIDSITLTSTTGQVVEPLASVERVDLANLSDIAELLEVPALPSGSYKSATIAIDFSAATIWLNLNGQAVAATPQNPAGTTPGVGVVIITFDPNNPLTISAGKSSRMAIDVDLAASNSINTSTATPTVTIQPFLVISPAPVDATVMRARGLFVTVPTGSSTYIMNIRPLTDLLSALGAVTVSTDTNTYFNINGVAYTGAAGLTAMASLPENTPTAAYGTLGDLSGITPGFHATSVYAGTTLESPLEDHIMGVVGARSGNSLTVHGATLITRVGPATVPFVNNATVTVGSSTVVSADGVAAAGLGLASVSVGQQVDVSGQASFDTSGNLSLDATAGQLRLASTRLWGTLSAAVPGSATLNVLTFNNFAPAGLTFTGTGTTGQDANPGAYLVNTGSATATGTLLQVDGLVTPFGSAPPDFTASAITAGAATQQRLVIEWVNGGATTPFTSISSIGLVPDLSNANLGTIHVIRTGPQPLDLTMLPPSPPFTITTVGADQTNLQLAVGSTTLATGISIYNGASGFATALTSTFAGTSKIYRLVAVGQYDAASNSFVAARISVALEE